MQSKNILYIWQSTYPWEVRAEKLTDSLILAGHDVSLLCRKIDSHKNANPKLSLFNLQSNPFNAPVPFSPVWTQEIKKIIKHKKIDLIIARDILVTPSALQAAKNFSIPVLIDMAEHYPAAMKGWKKYNSAFY